VRLERIRPGGLEGDQGRGHGVFRTVQMGRKVSGAPKANRKMPMQATASIIGGRKMESNAVRLQQVWPIAACRRETIQAPAGESAINPIRQHSTHFHSVFVEW
jgi:hypothetical protein